MKFKIQELWLPGNASEWLRLSKLFRINKIQSQGGFNLSVLGPGGSIEFDSGLITVRCVISADPNGAGQVVTRQFSASNCYWEPLAEKAEQPAQPGKQSKAA